MPAQMCKENVQGTSTFRNCQAHFGIVQHIAKLCRHILELCRYILNFEKCAGTFLNCASTFLTLKAQPGFSPE